MPGSKVEEVSTTGRAGLIIGATLGVLTLAALLLILTLRFCLRRSRLWTTSGSSRSAHGSTPPQFEDGASPALARLQRALSKGAGTTIAELDAVAPVEPFQCADDADSSENICAICLDEMHIGGKSRRLPCGHVFDAVCVEQWAAKANRCPICNACPVDPDEMALRRANRAATMLSEFAAPRTRRRRERDHDGVFRLAAITIGDTEVILLPPPPPSPPAESVVDPTVERNSPNGQSQLP